MSDASVDQLDAPLPPRFRRSLRPSVTLGALWRSRELLRALTERELRARYKQTFLGMAWAVITPVLLMVAFVAVVGRAVNIDTGGANYAVFTYLGLLPWTFFSTSVSRGGTILVLESSVLNKVRCPREVFPFATVAVAGIDLAVNVAVLAVLMLVTGTVPQATTMWVPLVLVVQIVFVVGVVLLLSIAVVYVRDLGQALPLLLQFGLFVTPVAYGIENMPDRFRTLLAFVNPLVGIIASYRETVLYGHAPPWGLLGPSALSSVVLLVVAYWVFKRGEGGIADVA